jgi:hypothetical protein
VATAQVDRLLTEIEARRRRALVTGIAVGGGSWLLAFLLLAVLTSLPSESIERDLATLLLILLLPGAPGLGYAAYSRVAPVTGVLLWLRRFRGSYGRRVRFHRPLAHACSGMLHPVTIQDSSFRFSFMAAMETRWLAVALIPVAWMVGFAVTLVVFFALGILTAQSGPGTMLLAVGLWTALFVYGLSQIFKRVGVSELQGQAARVEADRRLSSLKSGGHTVVFGVEILKCQDDVWRDVVSEAMSKADVVIVDITEPTENILWELGVALQRFGSEGLLLTIEEGTQLDPLAARVSRYLRSHGFGKLTPARIRQDVFVYPAVQARPGLGRANQLSALAKQLRREIAIRFYRTRAARA